jgi:Tfp pilus assembly protein PilZ
MSTTDEAASTGPEKKGSGSAERRAYVRRVAAARSGDELFAKRRLHERFKVADGRVKIALRNMIGLWKIAGPPCIVKNLGIGGISFITHAAVKVDQRIRLALRVPGKPTLPLKGHITHVTPNGQHSYVCGVAFTDYGASAWATLCDLYNQHAGNPATAEHAAAKPS